MGYLYYLVLLSVDNKKLASVLLNTFLIVEVLLHDSSYASHQPFCYFFDAVEGRHEDERWYWSICGKVRSPARSDRSSHDDDILLTAGSFSSEEIIKIEGILLDGIGDKCS